MKDIEFIIQYITTALIVVTPIAYTPDMIPSQLAPLLGLNPLYYYVTATQYLIVLNKFPPLTFSLISLTFLFNFHPISLTFFLKIKNNSL